MAESPSDGQGKRPAPPPPTPPRSAPPASATAAARGKPGQITAQGNLQVFEPATGKLLGEVRTHGEAQVREAIATSRAAQADWARRSFRARRAVLLRFQTLLLERADSLCEHLARETGKTRGEALYQEVLPVADLAAHFARHAERILRDERLPLHLFPHKKSTLRYLPRGVIGVIAPWNFPFSIPAGEVLMALAAGNGCVLKPSEHTPLIAEKLRALLDEAGAPHGLFQVVHGAAETGRSLVAGGVQMVSFTGSVATGRKVGMAAAEQLIPCVLELGGKDPALVLRDADLDLAARTIVWGAFANSGQVCASIERVYVDESIAEPFLEKVVALTRALRQGDPLSFDTDVGAMTTPHQILVVQQQLDEALRLGARVLVGGGVTNPIDGGRFIQPTVLTNVTHQMAVMREETFGPVLPVMTFRSEDEAVRLANDSPYGLSANVFTRDAARASRLAGELQAGTVVHNDALFTHAAPEAPWGGVKSSGIGKVHSAQGLRDRCEQRYLNLSRLPLPVPWQYPYSEKAYRIGLRLYRALLGRGLGGKLRALFDP